MLKKLIYSIYLFSFCYSSTIYSITYICPKVPIKATLGDKTTDGWLIWPQSESYNLIKQKFYAYQGTKYSITKWRALSGGRVENSYSNKKFFIECCYYLKKDKFVICAKKKIKESACKAIIPKSINSIERFNCLEENKT